MDIITEEFSLADRDEVETELKKFVDWSKMWATEKNGRVFFRLYDVENCQVVNIVWMLENTFGVKKG